MRYSLTCLALLPALLPTVSRAAPRRLTLGEAVEIAIKLDPIVAEARVGEDRAELGVLRAQLDRVSIKVDGSLQELWNKNGIGGEAVSLCGTALSTATGGPLPFTTPLDPATCQVIRGTPSLRESGSSGAQGLFNLSAQVNAPLFSGFRVSSNVRRAQRQRDAATVGWKQARKDTALAVARAYWSVRRVGLLREVQAQALERLKEAEAITNARVEAGLAPPIDRNRARLRRVQQLATLADLGGQEREAGASLAVSLGVAADEELVLTDAPSFPESGLPPLASLLDEAHRGRPEVATARLQLEIQQQQIRIAESAYYPQLGVFGLFQVGNNPFIPGQGARQASSSANPFGNVTGNLTLGAQLSMNFFDTFNTYTAVKDARYELLRLGGERRRIERVVETDVRAAYARLQRLYDRRPVLGEARDVAKDNLGILQARYQNGEALAFEFLDAAVELVNAELQLADNTAQLQLAWIDLDGALGHVIAEAAAEGGRS